MSTLHDSVKLPLDIDDEKATVLFSPFRGKNVNPISWNSKMNFWLNFLERTVMENRLITIDLNSFPHLFLRNGLTPKCLPTVLEELKRIGKVKAIEDYKRPNSSNSWVSWGFNTLLKEPLSWSVNQVFGSPKKPSSVFVWPDVLKVVSEEVLQCLQSDIRQSVMNRVLAYSKFEDICSDILANKDHFDLVGNYLQTSKKIHIEQCEQHGLLVKICEKNETCVSKIKPTDLHVFEINNACLKIENELNLLSNTIQRLTTDARGFVQSNKKLMALYCLKKRKRLDKVFTLRSSLLHNLEEILSKIEEAETNLMVIQACDAGLSVLKKINNDIGIDKAESVMEEMQEAIEDTEQISDAILNVTQDSSEDENALLEKELSALLAEDQKSVDENLPLDDLALPDLSSLSLSDLPDAPSHSPSLFAAKEECSKNETVSLLPS